MSENKTAKTPADGEPVAWGFRRIIDGVILDIKNSDEHEGYEETYTVPLYTAPPKREWVGLTDEEINDWFFQRLKQAGAGWALDDVVRAVEAKLKEKNT